MVLVLGAFSQSSGNEARVRETYQAGERALQQNDLATAENSFLSVLELVPRDIGARANLGVVYMREQKWSQAIEYLRQAEKLAPQVSGIRLNIGLAYYRQGDYASAIVPFESVVQDQPDSQQARRLLGLCYLFVDRYKDASAELEPLWPVANSDLSYLYSLAVAAGQGEQRELETRALTRLMEVGQDSALVHLLLGKAHLAHGDYEQALTELQAAAAADAKLPMLHYHLGVVYRHNGDTDKAQTEFLEDVGIEPNVAFNYDQLGTLASLQNDDQKAEKYFSEAVKRDRRLGTSWFGLAKTFKQEKRYTESLKALDQAGAIDPQSASVHYLRAQVLAALGRKTEARTELAAVQRLRKETRDKLEQEISGSTYRDPEAPAQ